MPFEQCLRFDQENNLTKSSASRGRHRGQLSSEDDEGEFLPAGDVRWAWLLALEDPQLLAQKEDLDIFVMLTSMTKPDEVEQQRERLREKKEKHAGLVLQGSCRSAQSSAKPNNVQLTKKALHSLRRIFRTLRGTVVRWATAPHQDRAA